MTAIAATSPAPIETEPLWTRARASFARAIDAVGAPAAIAAIAMLTRTLRREIVERLLRLEHIARKLLLADAAAIHRAQRQCDKTGPRVVHIELRSLGLANHVSRGSAALRAAHPAHSARSNPDISRPETWRAPFSFALPRDPHRVSNAQAPRIRALWGPTPPPPPPPAPRIVRAEDAAFRLARRFEAVRRVLENPRRYAERLARCLARAVRRFSAVVERYAWAPSRTAARDPHDERLGLDAYGPCTDVYDAFDSS